MEHESCAMCGGDGRVSNAFGGSSTSCPSCNGTGRRVDSGPIFRDVTKTKPSHYQASGKAAVPEKPTWPLTFEGSQLANDVKASGVTEVTKAKLIRDIIEYEADHGRCTQTFLKKVRKQIRD